LARLELSEAADADLAAILAYSIEAFGRETAEAYLRSFEDSFALLREHPRAGAIHPIVEPTIRSLSHRSHRIFYDVEADVIVVVRVLHKAMDVERWLGS
jgi:toxin ParE1/3/4